MSDVRQLSVKGVASRPAPRRILRPCDYGLKIAVHSLETQVGTVEAYNKLCDAAEALKNKIDSGKAEQQNPIFATDPEFIYPLGHVPKKR